MNIKDTPTVHQILLVEDDLKLAQFVKLELAQEGYEVTVEADGMTGLTTAREMTPDLILLDWMFPGGSGIQLAKRLKQDEFTRQIPIIMLTARGEEEDKVKGLEVGADDYITKPFSPKELVARIKAVLRRSAPTRLEETIDVQGLQLDPVSHRVSMGDEVLDMGPTEFRLLHFFMTHPERVYSREQLLDNVWGTNVYVEDRTVDVHIRRLRKAVQLGGYDKLIQTVRGAGYPFSSRM